MAAAATAPLAAIHARSAWAVELIAPDRRPSAPSAMHDTKQGQMRWRQGARRLHIALTAARGAGYATHSVLFPVVSLFARSPQWVHRSGTWCLRVARSRVASIRTTSTDRPDRSR